MGVLILMNRLKCVLLCFKCMFHLVWVQFVLVNRRGVLDHF